MATTAGRPVGEFEWPSAETSECPFPFYTALRRDEPVHKVPGRDEYLVSRWEDIAYIETHPELFSCQWSRVVPGAGLQARTGPAAAGPDYDFDYSPAGMAGCDPPEHTFKRKALLSLVSRERVRSYEPGVRAICEELVDGFAARGEVELSHAFARLVPLRVIVDILGFPRKDLEVFAAVGAGQGQGSRFMSADELAEQQRRQEMSSTYIVRAIEDRYEQPRDDFLSEMVHTQVQRDGKLNIPYLAGEASTLLFAGMLTTWHTIVNAMFLLLTHPDEAEHARVDPAWLRNVWEETVRLESPLQWLQRVTNDDVVLGGVEIPADSLIVMLFASGNRDEAHWEEPQRFWPGRPGLMKDHLGFGYGVHVCYGAPLARLEGAVALQTLLERLPNLRLAERNDFTHVPSPLFRALRELHVEFDLP